MSLRPDWAWYFIKPESFPLCQILDVNGILLGNLAKGLGSKSECVSLPSWSHTKLKTCVSEHGSVPDLNMEAKV